VPDKRNTKPKHYFDQRLTPYSLWWANSVPTSDNSLALRLDWLWRETR